MTLMAVLESDLRALSAEARRRHPAVKDAAEHAILKIRSLSSPNDIAQNEDILRIFLMACDCRSVKLSVIGLSCLQKLISHDAVAPSALSDILCTLIDHSDMTDETIQLKTLQTILIIFQSRLHPDNEENMAQALGVCLRLLENTRSSDSVRNTAAATFRQAVALIFDNVVHTESLPVGQTSFGVHVPKASSVIGDVSCTINQPGSLSRAGKLGYRLLEDLTALAVGGSALWLRVHSLQKIYVLDILEFVLSNYVSVFCYLSSYEQVLRHQICSLLMTSLRTNAEIEGEVGEPTFRRLVLRCVAHVIRLYSSSLVTECEVFLNTLIKVTRLDLPLWHQILVLEIFRSFCVEARTLRLLFQNFDMDPKNTNVVENIVKALARVVSIIQIPDTSEESLAAVAGMFSSKAKGIEWSMDNDASNAAVLIASEAHAITLAVEGLLGVVFTVASLTDEAVDIGELDSPKADFDSPPECTGKTAALCLAMVNCTWLTILDVLSLILARSNGEAIIVEILKGYQAFTQTCGVLHAIEPLNSFLASLCKFTINVPNEVEKRSALLSPGSKKSDSSIEQKEKIVLTPKNVQALRTLFNVAHRLHNVLGASWILVLETLAALDRTIHSPHASTQETSTSVSRLTREMSAQFSDFHILSSLNSQLFESSALMHISSVKSLLSALIQLSSQCISGSAAFSGQVSNQQIGNVLFSVERMTSILVNNLHRVEPLWDQVVSHLLEIVHHSNSQLRNLALDGLDQSICAVVGSCRFQVTDTTMDNLPYSLPGPHVNALNDKAGSFECTVLSSLMVLYKSSQSHDVHAGALKILLHVVERHGEKIYYSWPNVLEILRTVADTSDKDLIPFGFQILRIIMNEGLSTVPVQCLAECLEVTGSYSAQKAEINISLTAVGLLWTATDFIAKGLVYFPAMEPSKEEAKTVVEFITKQSSIPDGPESEKSLSIEVHNQVPMESLINRDRLLLSVFSVLQKLGGDERPEVRNSSIRTLFQTLGSHGHKFCRSMWENCLGDFVFPILDRVTFLAATSSRDEWQGTELGTHGGKTVHMLIHHSRNTAQKQWDETLVLVLGGFLRILRSFLPFLQSLSTFSEGWESLLNFIKQSIVHGSKEVALAAINCLQITVTTHCPKGNLSENYLKSILNVYEFVHQLSPSYWSNVNDKVKQEIVQSLGDIYVHAQPMFDSYMYLQLLSILHCAIRNSSHSDDMESELESISPLQLTIVEILPLLRPSVRLSSMWSYLLREILFFLLGDVASSQCSTDDLELSCDASYVVDATLVSSGHLSWEEHKQVKNYNESSREAAMVLNDVSGDRISISRKKKEAPTSYLGSPNDKMAFVYSQWFAERLVPVLVELFMVAPFVEKCIMRPEIIYALGRCMSTRRDRPEGALWRLATEHFNDVLIDDINVLHESYQLDQNWHKLVRARMWKEVAVVYETFLVGCCGRALPSISSSAETLRTDELIEMTVIDILVDKVLKGRIDAPNEVIWPPTDDNQIAKRLISTLDCCASRTGSLPIESVGLVPPHCSRFSLSCLRMMFSICHYNSEADWDPKRLEISKAAIILLVTRCRLVFRQFCIDESNLGNQPFPSIRIEETTFILQQLAELLIHPEVAFSLHLKPSLIDAFGEERNTTGVRSHLLILFPAFSELVISRESKIRELVQVLLRLVSTELRLENMDIST